MLIVRSGLATDEKKGTGIAGLSSKRIIEAVTEGDILLLRNSMNIDRNVVGNAQVYWVILIFS